MKYNIIKTETCTDFSELVDFENAATAETKVLQGFQVDFDVEALNDEGETRTFHIVYQTKGRENGLKAYGEYDMQLAYDAYGDESTDFERFLGNYAKRAFAEMQDEAESLAQDEYFEKFNAQFQGDSNEV